jgi:hypothetical protein
MKKLKAKANVFRRSYDKLRLPNHGLHSTDQLLGATLPSVDGGRRGLIEVGL